MDDLPFRRGDLGRASGRRPRCAGRRHKQVKHIPSTAYLMWAVDERERIKSREPGIALSEMNVRLGERWARIPGSVKRDLFDIHRDIIQQATEQAGPTHERMTTESIHGQVTSVYAAVNQKLVQRQIAAYPRQDSSSSEGIGLCPSSPRTENTSKRLQSLRWRKDSALSVTECTTQSCFEAKHCLPAGETTSPSVDQSIYSVCPSVCSQRPVAPLLKTSPDFAMAGHKGSLTTMEELRNLQEELLAEETKLALMKQVRQKQASGIAGCKANEITVSSGVGVRGSATNASHLGDERKHLPPPPPLKELRPAPRKVAPSAPPPLISQAVLEQQQANSPSHRQSPGPQLYSSGHGVHGSQSHTLPGTVGLERAAAYAMHNQRAQQIRSMQQEVDRILRSIWPPIPPQYPWSLVPSISATHFVSMVGLEECVRHIEAQRTGRELSSLNEAANRIKPICEHCKTDFAPFWRSFSNDEEMVTVCEKCDWLRVKYPFVQHHCVVLTDTLSKVAEQEVEIARLVSIHTEEEEKWLKEQQKFLAQQQYWKERQQLA